MKSCTLLGNITRDIEIKQTKNGKNYIRFGLAVNSGYGDNKRTDFFDVVAWNKTAENIAKFFQKGSKILLETTPMQDRYEDKNGNKSSRVEFWVSNFYFVESKNANNGSTGDLPPMPSTDDGFMNIPDGIDEELPFN